MNVKIFSPVGVKPEDYRHRYPELDKVSEFSELSAKALIFVWWYANQTSPLVDFIPDQYERAAEALKKSGFTPSKIEKERILRCQFDAGLAQAIGKMESFDPGARFKAYGMVKKIFDQYQDIVDRGPEAFKDVVKVKVLGGEGKEEIQEVAQIDYKRYVDVTAKIAEEMTTLLSKLEEGFAVVSTTGEEVQEDESTALRDWHQQKDT